VNNKQPKYYIVVVS